MNVDLAGWQVFHFLTSLSKLRKVTLMAAINVGKVELKENVKSPTRKRKKEDIEIVLSS